MDARIPCQLRTVAVVAFSIAFALLLLAALGSQSAWADPAEVTINQTVPTTITGTVSLQGRPVPPDASWITPLNVTFYFTGTSTVYKSVNVTTTNTGVFTVAGVDLYDWDIRVKGLHTLASRKNNVTVVTTTAPIDFGLLYEGDADGNNRINILDFSILATAYGKQSGQPGFDPRADFNNNGRIEILDFSLLATNYLMQGDIVVTGGLPDVAPEALDQRKQPTSQAGP